MHVPRLIWRKISAILLLPPCTFGTNTKLSRFRCTRGPCLLPIIISMSTESLPFVLCCKWQSIITSSSSGVSQLLCRSDEHFSSLHNFSLGITFHPPQSSAPSPWKMYFVLHYWLQLRDSWPFLLLSIEFPDFVSVNTLINQQWLTFFSCCLDLFPRPSHYLSFHLYCSPPSPSWSSSSTLPFEVPLRAFSIPHVGKRKCPLVNGSKCKSLDFYNSRIFKPTPRWDKYVNMLRDYAEKLSFEINIYCCNDFSLLWPSDHYLLNVWCTQPLSNMTSVWLNMQALILEGRLRQTAVLWLEMIYRQRYRL